MLFTSLAVATLSAVASAKTIRIDVGQSGLNFTPNDIKADVGDLLEFHYHAINHSVVASDFATPCKPKAEGGFYSGFFPTKSGENENVFQVEVSSTTPIWFYCSQTVGNHCGAGMVGAVNANVNKTLAAYKATAEKATSNESPSKGVFGGKVVSAASATKSAGSTGTSTSSPASATTTNAAAALGSISGMAMAVVGAAVAFAI